MSAPLTVVVINLVRRPHRLARFLYRWNNACPGVPVHIFKAVDGTATGRAAACLASHLQVLTDFPGPLLVLEDDACFTSGFTPTPPLPPPGWAVAWLGGQSRTPPHPVDATWATVDDLLRTHAYIAADPQSLAAELKVANPPRLDPYLARLALPQYVLRIRTVGQSAGLSDIDGRRRLTDEFWQ